MNVKKSLENSNRGWLPKEPKVTPKRFKINSMTNQSKFTLKNKTGRVGWILSSLGLIFVGLAASYYFLMLPDYLVVNRDFTLIAIILAFVFAYYQFRWKNRLKNKQNSNFSNSNQS